MTALEQLGAYVAGGDAVLPETRELLRLHVADSVGAWIAAMPTTEGRALLRWRATIGSSTASQNELDDVAINCGLARLSEIDDIHLASMTTPGGIVIPAALTLSRLVPAAPEALAPAIMVGYEVMIRLGLAIGGPTILYRGIWPTYFAAPFATAAVAARLLGLDARQSAHALALALTSASPGVGHHGAATGSRWFAVGRAAQNGVTAALAARDGFTSDINILDGTFLREVYGITLDSSALVDGLGKHHALAAVSFKPWCAARQTMAATAALRQLLDDGLAIDDITEIKVSLPPPQVKMVDHGVTAGDRASHLTSVPYQMAIAGLNPDAAYDVAQSPSVLPDGVRALMNKIRIEGDESLLTNYPRVWRARVRVAARGGSRERDISEVPGDPGCAFDADAIKAKFHRFVEPVLGASMAKMALENSLCALDHLSARQALQDALLRVRTELH